MKKYFFGILAFLFSSCLFAQSKGIVTIKGTVKGDLKGYNKIQLFNRTQKDSSIINNGQYTFSFPYDGPTIKMLYLEYTEKMALMYRPFGILIAEPGTYYVTSDANDMYATSSIKGPTNAVIYRQFEKNRDSAFRKINDEILKIYGKEWFKIEEKNPQFQNLQKSRDSLNEVFVLPLLESLIKTHPNEYVSAFVLQGSARQMGTLEKKEQLFSMLSSKMQKSSVGKDFEEYIQGVKNSKIGSIVEDFNLPDTNGINIAFSSFKGKYVLIDFWASWCGPCRQSFPHMREVYQKVKGDNFEIYSISIDKDKSAWLRAIKEEKNPWKQSLDTKNISQSGFAITGVPTTYLIDPSGKIIAKEIGFDSNGESEIEKKINSIANKNQQKAIPASELN